MPRIAPISTDQPGQANAIFGVMKKQMGSVPNIFTNYFNHVAQTEIDFPFVAAKPSESSLNHQKRSI